MAWPRSCWPRRGGWWWRCPGSPPPYSARWCTSPSWSAAPTDPIARRSRPTTANRHGEHSDTAIAPDDDRPPAEQDTATDDTGTDDTAARDTDRAAVLIAAGAGRRRLSRELGVTEYEARQLLTQTRLTATDTAPGDDTRTDDARAAVDAPATAPTTAGAPS